MLSRRQLAFAVCLLLQAVAASSAGADSQKPASPPDLGGSASSAEARGAACASTLEQFIPELDAVMTENPRSILEYHAVLSKYLFFNNGTPGLPPPLQGAMIEGCAVNQIVGIAKRSKFFYSADGPPNYQHHRVEFRSKAAKVSFGIDKITGNIIGPNASWIKVYP
jgi:hypothetical protein